MRPTAQNISRIAAIAFTAIVASPGQAATTSIATYTGFVQSGFDYGIFTNATSAQGIDLAGYAFTAKYLVDTTQPDFEISKPYDEFDVVEGSGSMTAYLTINGITKGGKSSFAYVAVQNNVSQPLRSEIFHSYEDHGDSAGENSYYFSTGVLTYGSSLTNSSFLNQAIDYVPHGTDITFGSAFFGFLFTPLADLKLQITHVTVAPTLVAAVPEPASWALMIGGFGIAGGALRRRKFGRLATA